MLDAHRGGCFFYAFPSHPFVYETAPYCTWVFFWFSMGNFISINSHLSNMFNAFLDEGKINKGRLLNIRQGA